MATGATLAGSVATQCLVSHRRLSPADQQLVQVAPLAFGAQWQVMGPMARTKGL